MKYDTIRTSYDYIQFHLTLSRSSDFDGLIFSIKKEKKKMKRLEFIFSMLLKIF